MIVLANKQQENITSLELVEQINIFRKEENKKAELKHSDLLKVIRDEFEEEIGLGKISSSSYQVEAFRYYEHMVDVFYRELSKVA